MITVYQCGFCSHTSENSKGMQKHEMYCEHNPKNKNCASCDCLFNKGGARGAFCLIGRPIEEHNVLGGKPCGVWVPKR